MRAPEFTDILDAKRVIDRHLQPTPLHHYPRLSAELGFEVYIKHENHHPIGAFKVRGGINLISRLSAEEKAAGVVSASTGNHGQSVAYAARLFAVKALIAVPENPNPDKVASIRALGATVEIHGRDFDEARLWVEETAQSRGYRYVHSANEPLLVAGVGTIGLEILYAQPDVDVIIAPVGGGSGAAGISIAAKAINPQIRMIAVQSEHARVAHDSWRERRILSSDVCTTFAEGMATRQAFELTQGILVRHLDDFVLVSDEELERAIRVLFEHTHNIAEGAGAASMAAALKLRHELAGKKVALDLSGGNITLERLLRVLRASAIS
jgi:threonine dehydratase